MSGAHSDKVTNKCLMPSRYQSTNLLLLLLLLSDGTCVSVYVYIYGFYYHYYYTIRFGRPRRRRRPFGNRRNSSQFGWPRE